MNRLKLSLRSLKTVSQLKRYTTKSQNENLPRGANCTTEFKSLTSNEVSIDAAKQVQRVGIIGAGQMGSGIAYVAAKIAKIDVMLMDQKKSILDTAFNSLGKQIEKALSKEKSTDPKTDLKTILKRIKPVSNYNELSHCDYVIECVSEKLEIKKSVFEQAANVISQGAILASNTSSICISALSQYSINSKNVIGMHFMNPGEINILKPLDLLSFQLMLKKISLVPIMKLVEIIPSPDTSLETIQTTARFAHDLGKITSFSKDVPGFIANRLLMPYINEACLVLQEGTASVEDIDKTMLHGTNMPMGPLALADLIGLDTCLAIMRQLHEGFGDSKYRPSIILRNLVYAGKLGRKTKQGFYVY